MATGMKNQLTKQVGEYLVACELARRGYLSATFSGNVPELDIIATNKEGKTKLIQVKTTNSETWQFSIDRFVDIHMEGNKQIIGKTKDFPIKDLICVFVHANEYYGNDEFYIIKWSKLAEMLISGHSNYLNKHDGERPKSKESMHTAISRKQLTKYKDKWELIVGK